MRHRFVVQVVCLLLPVWLLTACTGDSSTPATVAGDSSAPAGPAATLTGVASKGPLNGAQVCAWQVVNGAKGPLIAPCVKTGADGQYDLPLGAVSGSVLVEVSGGSYVDEASGLTVELSSPLHTVLETVPGGTVPVAVTAVTELSYQLALAAPGGLTVTNIHNAVGTVEANAGVGNIIGTQPVDALSPPSGASPEALTYALELATVAEYQAAQPAGTTLAQALDTLRACLDAGTDTVCASVQAQLSNAEAAFFTAHGSFPLIEVPQARFGQLVTLPIVGRPTAATGVTVALTGGLAGNSGSIVAGTAVAYFLSDSSGYAMIWFDSAQQPFGLDVTAWYGAVMLSSVLIGQDASGNATTLVSHCLLSGTPISGSPALSSCTAAGVSFDGPHGLVSFANTALTVNGCGGGVPVVVNGSLNFSSVASNFFNKISSQTLDAVTTAGSNTAACSLP